MSRRNVEIVERIMDAQARRDWPALSAHYDPEIVSTNGIDVEDPWPRCGPYPTASS